MTAPNLLESSEQAELYLRGSGTLLASWEAYARGATGAAVHRLPGVAAAVFPHEPERAVYNNALLERDLGAGDRSVPWTRRKPCTPRPAWPASPPGCTRATSRCAPSWSGAVTPWTRRPLQSTPMAERVYAAVGFRDLGRILEYVP